MSIPTVLVLQLCTAMPSFDMGAGNLNPGSHAYAVDTLTTEPTPFKSKQKQKKLKPWVNLIESDLMAVKLLILA